MLHALIRGLAVLGLLLYGLFALLSVFVVWGVVYAFALQWTPYHLVILGAAGFYFVLLVRLFRRTNRIHYLIRIVRGEERG